MDTYLTRRTSLRKINMHPQVSALVTRDSAGSKNSQPAVETWCIVQRVYPSSTQWFQARDQVDPSRKTKTFWTEVSHLISGVVPLVGHSCRTRLWDKVASSQLPAPHNCSAYCVANAKIYRPSAHEDPFVLSGSVTGPLEGCEPSPRLSASFSGAGFRANELRLELAKVIVKGLDGMSWDLH